MRRITMIAFSLVVSSCALSEGIHPGADPGTDPTAGTTSTPVTVVVSEQDRLGAIAVTGQLIEAVLARDGRAIADLTVDPPSAIQDVVDTWATAIGLVDGRYTVIGDRFGQGTAEIDVRLELDLLEVGSWTYETTVPLVGGDPWTVLWSVGVLHPRLEPGDELRVDRQWPPRASILARDGTELAGAEPIKVIGVVPAWIEDLDDLTDQLARLAAIQPAVVIREITNPIVQPDWFVPVGRIKEVVYTAVGPEIEAIPGVIVRDGTERLPFRTDFAAHLVGTAGPMTAEQLERLGSPYGPTDTIGQTGIEASYETLLAGSPRTAIVRVNKFGRVIEELLLVEAVEPTPVRTTIDIGVQSALEEVLQDDDRRLAVVVIDTETGEVLGSASRPLSSGFDRALAGTYPPGSTFKIVTATALLENGMSAGTEVACPDRVTLGGRTIRNAGDRDLGTIDLIEAFAASCNTTFAAAAVNRLDPGVLADTAARFGFGSDPAAGVPSARSQFPEPADTAELAAAAIGQGRVIVTPLHMASVAAAVAAGTWYPPTVIQREEPSNGFELERSAVSTLADMMRAVVEEGTGTNASVPGIVVRGKTGSAEFDDSGDTHAWFVGFWDGFAIAVVVEAAGGGGSVAAPIARQIIEAISG